MKNYINFSLETRKGNREVNQDALMCSYNKHGEFCAVVCDGVGSISQSQIASKLVVNVFTDEFAKLDKIEFPIKWFKETLAVCLQKLKEKAKDPALADIATTVALLIITKDKKYYSFNIGDTRIYKIDEKVAKIVSFDHNYKNFLIRKEASRQEIEEARNKWNCLTNFIDASHPEAAQFETNSGDIINKTMFLLCTDGMYNSFNCQELQNIVWTKHFVFLPVKSGQLMRFCSKKDKSDNLTCILVGTK